MYGCLNIFFECENAFTRKFKKSPIISEKNIKKSKSKNGYTLVPDQSYEGLHTCEYFEFNGKYWTRETFLQTAEYALKVYQNLEKSFISEKTRKQVINLLRLGIKDEQHMFATLVGLERYHLNEEKTCIIFE
ncbi:hypothetical protein QJ854_gp676 [Moumouvirus goulette]|uniref:Uncharacterized protein n=1 Tax=Moumouvirus goulette TaxID=1247379 RepID=M1PMD3_9VIRU|nr:hypothetical protein QJ854_gp676 [Moumouvirus goulette]AGF85106.1 hypothetical protein glt_00297 [Moumouvirus goulette]